MQPGSDAKDATVFHLLEERSGCRASESIEKAESDAGSLSRAARMRISSASGGADTGHDGGFEAAVGRERVTPQLQEAGFAESELAIGIDAGTALAVEDFGPRRSVVGFGCIRGADEIGEDVEVMNFTKKILEALEITAPCFVLDGEESFGGVAEALQSDAEFVPGPRLLGAESAGVEFTGGFEALKCEAFGGKSARRDQASAAGQMTLEMLPLLAIKLACSLKGVLQEAGKL